MEINRFFYLFKKNIHSSFFVTLFFVTLSKTSYADTTPVRLKDLVDIRGNRSNPLVGFGLVVGLPGTGDSKASLVTNQAISTLLSQLGPKVAPQDVLTKNMAAVLITADLPPHARIGQSLDIRLSSIGDAGSLEGGSLVMTPLQGPDGKVYAVAQGTVSMGWPMAGKQGGGRASGSNGNVPKTIALSLGAKVEREWESTFIQPGNTIELALKNPDFTTASRAVLAINENCGDYLAHAENSGLIKVRIPKGVGPASEQLGIVDFMARLEQIPVIPDKRALIVINERTGTIIAGHEVILEKVTLSHGNLEIQINDDETKMLGELKGAATVSDLVKALQAFGAGPKDLVAIFQTLHSAQALKAELKFM